MAQRLAQVLYTHKAGGSNPSSPTTDLIGSQLWGPFIFGPIAEGFEPARVRSCGNAKRFPAQHARSEATKRKRAAPAARGHPSSPTTELETVLARGPFLFAPSAWDSNPSTRLSQRPWPENGKNEYCYLAYNISKDSICLSYATYVHYKD